MLQADRALEDELREAVRLATSYATDSLNLKTHDEVLKFPQESFIAKCHEGFDRAQKLILKNLLALKTTLGRYERNLTYMQKEKRKGNYSETKHTRSSKERRIGS